MSLGRWDPAHTVMPAVLDRLQDVSLLKLWDQEAPSLPEPLDPGGDVGCDHGAQHLPRGDRSGPDSVTAANRRGDLLARIRAWGCDRLLYADRDEVDHPDHPRGDTLHPPDGSALSSGRLVR